MDQKVSNKLKNFQTMQWLRNRFRNQVKDKYILNEQELKEQIMMKAVFISIDRDKSKFLDRSELYDMFRKYGINITRQKLKEFFKKIDQDDDDKLSWTDFKQALQNQEALAMFVELMRKIRASDDPCSSNFIPLSFPNMIQYMNYCVLREELIQNIESDSLNAAQKVKQCRNLLTLEELCYRNIQNVKEDNEEEEQIIQQSKRSDHQQISRMKRQQEKELQQLRQSRIRKLSTSNYYKSCVDTEHYATSRQLIDQKSYQSQIQQSLAKASNQFGKLIETLTDEIQQGQEVINKTINQIQVPEKPPRNSQKPDENNYQSDPIFKQQQTIQDSSDNQQDFYYARKIHRSSRSDINKQVQEITKGSHFINQIFLNNRTPGKVRQKLKNPSPRKRIVSQVQYTRQFSVF